MEKTKDLIASGFYCAYNRTSTDWVWTAMGGIVGTTGKYGFFGYRPNGGYRYAFSMMFNTPAWSGDLKQLHIGFKYTMEYSSSVECYLTITTSDAMALGDVYTGLEPGEDSGAVYQELITLTGTAGGEYDYSADIDITDLEPDTNYKLVLSPATASSSNYCGIATIAPSGYITYEAAASGVDANDGYFGTAVAISMTNDGMSHVLTYELYKGDTRLTSGSITTTTASSYSWRPSTSLMSYIPEDLSCTCRIICTTEAGAESVDITLSVPDYVKPTITGGSISAVNDNTTVAGWGIYLQNFSKIKAALQAYANLSTIKSWTIDCGAVVMTAEVDAEEISISQTSDVLTVSGNYSVTATATDARGRVSDSYSLGSYTIVAYSDPTITGQSVYRCNAAGTEDKKNGTYLRAYAVSSYSSINGKNSATLAFKYKEKSASTYTTVTLTSGTALITGNGTIDVLKSYSAQIVVTDKLKSATYTVVVGSQAIPFHLKPSAKSGVGFGGYAEDDEIVDVLGDWKFRILSGEKMLVGTATLEGYVNALIQGGGNPIAYEDLTTHPAINNHTIGIDNSLADIGAVTAVDSESTDTEFPTAKCLYDALQNIPSGSGGLFFCTYGTTTYSEIVSAIGEGKLPVVYYGTSSTLKRLYVISQVLSTQITFTVATGPSSSTSTAGQTLITLKVTNGNAWSMESSVGENTNNRQTEINDTTAATAAYYPNVAAVKNYVDGKSSTPAWGNITGTLSDQTDLSDALDGKADKQSTTDAYTHAYTYTSSGDSNLKVESASSKSGSALTIREKDGCFVATMDSDTTSFNSHASAGAFGQRYAAPKFYVDEKFAAAGTITEITMNGASKGTSGSVDLGTVITAHQDISGKIDKPSADPEAGQVLAANADGSTYWKTVQGGTGSTDYSDLTNKPKINSKELSGNVSLSDIGAAAASHTHTKSQISDFPTIGAAAAKAVDTSIAAASTSANLPTSAAVATFVEGKGYTANTGTITGVTMNGASKGTSGVVNLGTVLTAHQDISGKENSSNKVTSISSSSTDTQYPSAKCVYALIGNIESALEALI